MFTRITVSILISLLSILLHAQENQVESSSSKGVTIVVKIPKISSDKGKVYFSLYNSESDFIKRIPFQKATGSIIDRATEVKFTDVPKGTYAIICFHDANDNKKLDFNGFRPIEDYGASNNPVVYGPPQFGLSAFSVDNENIEMYINF